MSYRLNSVTYKQLVICCTVDAMYGSVARDSYEDKSEAGETEQ
jgi:hypothetical protein